MNPDNPNFRTPEEECRELVKARETIARQERVIEKLKDKLEEIRWSWANDAGRQCDNLAFEALAAIEHYMDTLEADLDDAKKTIARQAKVIEKIKELLSDITKSAGIVCCDIRETIERAEGEKE